MSMLKPRFFTLPFLLGKPEAIRGLSWLAAPAPAGMKVCA